VTQKVSQYKNIEIVLKPSVRLGFQKKIDYKMSTSILYVCIK